MTYRDLHVVVTGGTGALGAAVVEALIADGAICHIPWRDKAEAERFPYRDNKQVKLVGPIELSDEAAVGRFYASVPALWASIHIAGGFAFGPVAKTTKADLMKLVDTNLVSAFLCSAAAVNAIAATGKGGRIVNVAARPALE
jgi:NAD(P)-dependent dehydrogenase (short-subunit alcohol dehydrogenase family)